MCQEALDLERSNGGERTESKCRKDEDLDLWYGPGPPVGKFPCTVTTRSSELLARLGIEDLDFILKERRLHWYGHVGRSNGAVKTTFDIQVDGKCGPGRPKIMWK